MVAYIRGLDDNVRGEFALQRDVPLIDPRRTACVPILKGRRVVDLARLAAVFPGLSSSRKSPPWCTASLRQKSPRAPRRMSKLKLRVFQPTPTAPGPAPSGVLPYEGPNRSAAPSWERTGKRCPAAGRSHTDTWS